MLLNKRLSSLRTKFVAITLSMVFACNELTDSNYNVVLQSLTYATLIIRLYNNNNNNNKRLITCSSQSLLNH